MTHPTPALATERLTLDPLRVTDAGVMAIVLADSGLYRFIGGAPPTAAELRQRYARQLAGAPPGTGATWHSWVVRTRVPPEAIGYVQATITDHGRAADIAWVIGVPWQGRGYATEAARGLAAWLDASGVERLTAHVHPDHAASAGVAASIGLGATDAIEDGERVWCRLRGGASGGS